MRASMLTGMHPLTHGVVTNDIQLREDVPTIAKSLSAAGYRMGYIGKWHLDGSDRGCFTPPGPRRQGFEFWAANECSHAHFNSQYFRDSETPLPIRKFEPEVWTDLGIEFLRSADKRPWFLTIQMGPPHDPYKAPPGYAPDPGKIAMRPNWRAGERVPGREAIAEYYGMVNAIDEQVGRILAELQARGMAEDTLVFLSSDHGDMLGSHGLRLKRKPWEESVLVPGILRYPRGLKRGTSDCIFTHVDFAPTLLGFCGVKPPPEMQGVDLSRALAGEGKGPDSAFFQIFGPYAGDGTEDGWRGVRTRRRMYARYESRPWVLYDLERDPYQMRNLVDDPGSRKVMEEMERRLKDWMARTGDSWALNWHEPVEDGGRLYRGGVFYTVEEYLKSAARP